MRCFAALAFGCRLHRMKILKRLLKMLFVALGVTMLAVLILAVYNFFAVRAEASRLIPPGRMVDLDGYRVHVYSEGENEASPALIFMSGSATAAPVYDFKALYGKLSDEYRIAVVEKAGYGYSDIVQVERDVVSMVNEVRGALIGAGIEAPYVLVPHSMSGLEAICWAQSFPNEIAGIAGIDMSVPYSYDDFDFERVKTMRTLGRLSVTLGLTRIPGVYPINEEPLDETEKTQQRLLVHRNAVNSVYIAEGEMVYENAQIVKSGGAISCPILMFCSDGKEIGDFWLPTQERFAKENDAELVTFDCGHYIHYYKSGEMAEHIKSFMNKLP